MIKRVSCVKIYWNDSTGMVPSYYPTMNKAMSAIDTLLNFGGYHKSAESIQIRRTYKVLNMDNPRDIAWYNKFIGRTCMLDGSFDVSNTSVAVPAKPVEIKKPEVSVKTEVKIQAPALVQTTLPLVDSVPARQTSIGFENTYNPKCQAAGVKGGLATRGVKRCPCLDRRPRGTVNVDSMAVQEKRDYWRWSKLRAKMRRSGMKPVSWDDWKNFGN